MTAITLPLRGRDEQLATIAGRLSHARAGAGLVLLVAAPPGMGRTRLLDEAAAMAARTGMAVGRGRAVEGHERSALRRRAAGRPLLGPASFVGAGRPCPGELAWHLVTRASETDPSVLSFAQTAVEQARRVGWTT